MPVDGVRLVVSPLRSEQKFVVVVPDGHPLLDHATIGLEQLASYPLITYDIGFTGRSHIDDAFKKAGFTTDIVLTAMDSDVWHCTACPPNSRK